MAAASLWGALILAVSLSPAGSGGLYAFRACVLCSESAALSGLLLNVVLYAPLGVLLRVLSGSWWVSATACLALSGLVESVQLVVPGRFSALEDLIANGAGGAVGATMGGRTVDVLFPPRTLGARLLAGSWSVLVAALVLLPSWIFRPVVPEGALYGQLSPALGGRPPYGGTVLRATVGDLPVANGRIARDREMASLLEDEYHLTLTFTVGEDPGYPVPVLRIVGEERLGFPQVLGITVDGEDVTYGVRFLADAIMLDRPYYRVHGALEGADVGDTVTVELWGDAAGPRRVSVGEPDDIEPATTVGRGWGALIHPDGISQRSTRALDALWLLLVAFPIGWWAWGAAVAAGLTTLPVVALGVTLYGGTPVIASPEHLAAIIFGVVLGLGVRHALGHGAENVIRRSVEEAGLSHRGMDT